MSWDFSFINTLISFFALIISFIAGVVATIFYFGNPFTAPFILEVFISNEQHSSLPIGFKVKNTTQHSLKTDIAITPIVLDKKYGTINCYYVLNPDQEHVEERIKGDYTYISHINTWHDLNNLSYQNNRQPLKFELQAHFKNSRFKVLKIHNSTKIITAYDPTSRTFRRVE